MVRNWFTMGGAWKHTHYNILIPTRSFNIQGKCMDKADGGYRNTSLCFIQWLSPQWWLLASSFRFLCASAGTYWNRINNGESLLGMLTLKYQLHCSVVFRSQASTCWSHGPLTHCLAISWTAYIWCTPKSESTIISPGKEYMGRTSTWRHKTVV